MTNPMPRYPIEKMRIETSPIATNFCLEYNALIGINILLKTVFKTGIAKSITVRKIPIAIELFQLPLIASKNPIKTIIIVNNLYCQGNNWKK